MLYKKKRVYNNIFNVGFKSNSVFTSSCIIFIRSRCSKCLSCSWNSLYGLECKLWNLSPPNNHSFYSIHSLYRLCQSIDFESRNYYYILLSI